MTTILNKILNKLPSVKLDWKSYYHDEFKKLHGGTPVAYQDKILFQDAWQYSATEYHGPEYPPPEDPWEAWELKCTYWKLRKAEDERTLLQTQAMLERLEDLQRTRSAPVQQSTRYYDPDKQTTVRSKGPLDLESLEGRITWLKGDIQESTEKLAELQAREKANGTAR